MGESKGHPPVKLIVGMIAADASLFSAVEARLSHKFGRADFWSDAIPFDYTDYYTKEMGTDLLRKFVSFEKLIQPEEIVEIKLFTNGRYVRCASGTGYMTTVVIIAGGSHSKKLGVPGEEKLQGKGVFNCAFCDGSQFADQVVAVCGGGDAGITEALYMTKLASRVIVIEAMPALTASTILEERASANPKLEIRCGTKVEAIVGDSQVEGVELLDVEGQRETLKVDGVLVHVGLEPNTSYLKDLVPLDSGGQIIVNERMETKVPYILAAGDIRSGSPNQIITAAGDGATAALSAERLLQELA